MHHHQGEGVDALRKIIHDAIDRDGCRQCALSWHVHEQLRCAEAFQQGVIWLAAPNRLEILFASCLQHLFSIAVIGRLCRCRKQRAGIQQRCASQAGKQSKRTRCDIHDGRGTRLSIAQATPTRLHAAQGSMNARHGQLSR